jgi:hypothetical protein
MLAAAEAVEVAHHLHEDLAGEVLRLGGIEPAQVPEQLRRRAVQSILGRLAREREQIVGAEPAETHPDELQAEGTLLDFPPTPREVWVDPELLETLKSLYRSLDGAVAFVSGRSVADRGAVREDV